MFKRLQSTVEIIMDSISIVNHDLVKGNGTFDINGHFFSFFVFTHSSVFVGRPFLVGLRHTVPIVPTNNFITLLFALDIRLRDLITMTRLFRIYGDRTFCGKRLFPSRLIFIHRDGHPSTRNKLAVWIFRTINFISGRRPSPSRTIIR